MKQRFRRRRKTLILASACVLTIAVASAVVFLTFRNRATPVSLQSAVHHYRGTLGKGDAVVAVTDTAPVTTTTTAATRGRPVRQTAATSGPSTKPVDLRPGPGVYQYRTAGYEYVPRLHARRDYPSQTTATVIHESGCDFRLRVDLIAEHTDGYQFCTTAKGMEWKGLSISITWFGIHRTLVFGCEGVDLLLKGATPGSTRQGSCRGDAGSTTMQLTERAPEAVDVGGVSVRAARVDLLMTISGEFQGTGRYSFWLDPASGLVLHMIRSVDAEGSTPFGRQRYIEHHESSLLALHPTT